MKAAEDHTGDALSILIPTPQQKENQHDLKISKDDMRLLIIVMHQINPKSLSFPRHFLGHSAGAAPDPGAVVASELLCSDAGLRNCRLLEASGASYLGSTFTLMVSS